jgi:imidazolonepropionase-like amidohydrolase
MQHILCSVTHRSWLAALALVTLAATVSTAELSLRQTALVIENVTLVSPERDGPVEGMRVLVRDGRIAAIGPEIPAGPDARRIDGRGRYLIPGLIDSHVHVGSAGPVDESAVQGPALLNAYRAQLPRAFLAFGFTTLVDVDLKPADRAWFEGAPLRPRLMHCGAGVRIPGGYRALRVRPERAGQDYPNLLYEPSRAGSWPATIDPTDHTPARAVERVAEAGGSCVKVFVESGFGVFDWPVPLPETLDALRAETRRRGLTFVVHATSVESWRTAVRASADVIAHGLWHWPGDRTNAAPPPEARSVVEAAARAGIRVQPTLRVVDNDKAVFDSTILDDPRLAWSLPRSVAEYLRSGEAATARRAQAEDYEKIARDMGVQVGAAALIDAGRARAMATARLMAGAGVPLIFGSDTPSGDGIGNPPGLNGRLELQRWSEAGVPLARILRGATLANAETFGLANEVGTIEVGKRADLVLLRENPLASVAAYDTVEVVFLEGEPIEREALRPAN